MTKNEIIRMAREAFSDKEFNAVTVESGPYSITKATTGLERFAAMVTEAEREVCAKVCEKEMQRWNSEGQDNLRDFKLCIAAIRAH